MKQMKQDGRALGGFMTLETLKSAKFIQMNTFVCHWFAGMCVCLADIVRGSD